MINPINRFKNFLVKSSLSGKSRADVKGVNLYAVREDNLPPSDDVAKSLKGLAGEEHRLMKRGLFRIMGATLGLGASAGLAVLSLAFDSTVIGIPVGAAVFGAAVALSAASASYAVAGLKDTLAGSVAGGLHAEWKEKDYYEDSWEEADSAIGGKTDASPEEQDTLAESIVAKQPSDIEAESETKEELSTGKKDENDYYEGELIPDASPEEQEKYRQGTARLFGHKESHPVKPDTSQGPINTPAPGAQLKPSETQKEVEGFKENL